MSAADDYSAAATAELRQGRRLTRLGKYAEAQDAFARAADYAGDAAFAIAHRADDDDDEEEM